jgi:hypothetical protein
MRPYIALAVYGPLTRAEIQKCLQYKGSGGSKSFVHLFYVFVVASLGLLAYNIGNVMASIGSTFFTADGYAVVAIYGDEYVAVSYRPRRRWTPMLDRATFGSDVKIFTAGQQTPMKFKREDIGQLVSNEQFDNPWMIFVVK